MIAASDGDLHIYMLNVGQGDTTIIVSPMGNVVVIDAKNASKMIKLLNDLGNDDKIEQLIITHPHNDHFSGGNGLAVAFTIVNATVAPFWFEFAKGPPTYRKLMGRFLTDNTNCSFLAGYSRWFPDGVTTIPAGSTEPELDPDQPYLEMLGPTNKLIRALEDANVVDANHLTIMTRLTWRKKFRMISAGDAQMENWQGFDEERLLEEKCHVLRTAHHGSSNGTQWERINRLSPSEVIVSSNPPGGHELPDLMSSAIFTKYNRDSGGKNFITSDTGTIHLQVTPVGTRTYEMFGEATSANVVLGAATPLDETNNPTDWQSLLEDRLANF